MCVCVCLRDRDRDRETDGEIDRSIRLTSILKSIVTFKSKV